MDEPIPKRLESVKHMQLKDADMLRHKFLHCQKLLITEKEVLFQCGNGLTTQSFNFN